LEAVRSTAEKIGLDKALRPMTATIADALGLAAKGRVQPGKDADLLIFGDELELADVFMKGRRMMQDGKVIVKGAFEA